MEQEIQLEDIKTLIFSYIFHVFLFIVYLVLHLIVHSKVFWIINSLGIFFLVGSYFNILYILFPIYPFIIIFKKKYRKKIFYSLKIMTFVLLIIVLIIGLILSLLFLINTIQSKKFCKECPFYLSIKHLNYVLGPYLSNNERNHDIKSKCKEKRCVLDNESLNEQYPFTYLCNYDPSEDFDDDETYTRITENGVEISVKKQLICTSVSRFYNLIIFDHSELYLYLDLCFDFSDFYRCKRFNKPEEGYNLDLDTECPDETYLTLIYIACALIIILDIIFAILPLGLEYLIIKKLLVILGNIRRKTNSFCSTARSSKISQDEGNFKKEITPVIIIEPKIINNVWINIDNDNESEMELHLKNNAIKLNKFIHKKERNLFNPDKINKIILNNPNILTDKNLQNQDIYFVTNKESKYQNQNRKINGFPKNTPHNPNKINHLEIQINNKNS